MNKSTQEQISKFIIFTF